MHAIKIGLLVGGAIITAFSVIPLIRNDYWIFRIFEYPRLQKLFINLVIILLYIFWVGAGTPFDIAFLVLLSANAAYLFYQIFPFTFFAKKVIVSPDRQDPSNQLTIVSSNVFQDNRNVSGCLEMLRKSDPDIILLLETDQFWCQETESLKSKYPYHVLAPQDNTYGMLLYSRFELLDSQIRFLVDDEIPSIRAKVKLPSEKIIRLYCVHPTPPVPGENSRSTERDKELLIVAKEVKQDALPAIVIGDLNDVAWSYTTDLFTKMSGLLDPRVGRGLYNTFHAKLPFLRFPLDHVFCSTDFKLLRIARLDNFNSDHFPILIRLQYEQLAHTEQEEPEADAGEQQLAEEKLAKDVTG